MIKMLLDQGLPRTAASLLRERGWDVQHVSERGMSRAEDSAIIALARLEQRMVVTLDADFHALLAVSGATGPSV
jgi:predicted nuclease of predicted toxin-antitoxin system